MARSNVMLWATIAAQGSNSARQAVSSSEWPRTDGMLMP